MKHCERRLFIAFQIRPARRGDTVFSISERLGADLHERVKNAIRTIIRWEGGDHVGPHGFPCKRCRPFPFYIYYQIEGDTVYFIGLVHEARHPDFLEERKES